MLNTESKTCPICKNEMHDRHFSPDMKGFHCTKCLEHKNANIVIRGKKAAHAA